MPLPRISGSTYSRFISQTPSEDGRMPTQPAGRPSNSAKNSRPAGAA
jgi:hypothetical protein